MAGTRALFASIGVSVSLIAAAALSLLAISAIFAFGVWSAPVSQSVRKPALVFADPTPAGPQTGDGGSSRQVTTSTSPIVVSSRVRPPRRRSASRPGDGALRRPRTADRPAVRGLPAAGASTSAVSPRATQDVAPPAPAAVARKKSAGEGVRAVGEGLSAKVENTGKALAQVTQTLSPPVSVAAQEVLDIVAALVRRSTSGLGGVLDALLPPK